jgi:hypothetical protein
LHTAPETEHREYYTDDETMIMTIRIANLRWTTTAGDRH